MIPIISESFAQEEFSILETGIISTVTDDYDISGKFEIRVIGDGDIIRMKGITVSGNPYYAYQRVIDGEQIISGKIFIDGKAVPLINKVIEPSTNIQNIEKENTTEKNLIVQIESADSSRYYQYYTFSVKVYDADVNPYPELFSKTDGLLNAIPVNATIIDKNGNLLVSFEGITDKSGKFSGSYYWEYNDPIGNYEIVFDVNNGNYVEKLTTNYLGYIPTENDPPPP